MPGKVAETGPPSPPSAIITDNNNNNNNVNARHAKKTRDLPNLSECHNCGYRINTTNGRDRLQTLRSEWRIVLLCKKCVKLVDSGESCPYCFSEASSKEEDWFRCRDCSRRVHERCVLNNKGLAPSSYYCCFSPGSGFTVCLDCWLPEPLLKLRSRAGFKGGSRRRKVSKSGNGGPVVVVSKDSRVMALEDAVKDANSAMEKKVVAAAKAREIAANKAVAARKATEVASTALDLVSKRDESGFKVLEDAVKDANSAMEKKAVAAAKAREIAANKAVVARKAVESASTALDLVSKRDESSANSDAANRDVDDAELAIQLHRELNSSRRISKNVCWVNLSCLSVPETVFCNGKSSNRAVSEVMGQQENGNCNEGNFNVEEKSCTDKLINSSGDDDSLDTGSQSCGRGDENEMHLNDVQSHCDTRTDRYYLKYRRRKPIANATPRYTQSCGNEIQPNNIRNNCQSDCDTKTIDRYYLKYSKSRLKATPRYTQSCGNEMQPNNIQSHCPSDCDMKSDNYCLKHSKTDSSLKATQRCRPKFLYEGAQLDSQFSDAGSLQNCSKKSKICSDALFQSCAGSLQTYACASGSV